MKKQLLFSLFLSMLFILIITTGCKEEEDYTFEDYENGIIITSASEKTKSTYHLTLPEEINGKKVLAIGEKAFLKSDFINVTFSSNIIRIEKSAFQDCKSLQEVNLNEGLEYIGISAFANCYSLFSLNIPFSTVKIDDHAFEKCYSLVNYSLRLFPNYKMIGEGEQKTFEYPKLKHIGDFAFYHCALGNNIQVFSDLDYIGKFAFAYTEVQSLQFQKIKEVGSYAFSYSYYLQEVTISNDDVILGEGLFNHCYELIPTRIIINVIPDGSNAAFQGYPHLYKVTLSNEIIVEGAFRKCYSLYNVTISDTVKVIDEFAFSSCFNLEEITIPENVEIIERGAFSDCLNLKSLIVLGNPKINEFGILWNRSYDQIYTKVYCYKNTHIEEYCISNDIDYDIIN